MANFTSGFGWVIVGLFVLVGLIVGWKAGGFIAGVAGRIILGLAGIPFIVMGQLVSVFLDQKELLEEILNETKKA